jgi:hypothetical protein
LFSPENAYTKLLEFAVQAGATEGKLRPASRIPRLRILGGQSMAEGKAMDVTSTPTSFVVFRRMVGPKQEVLEQYYRGLR